MQNMQNACGLSTEMDRGNYNELHPLFSLSHVWAVDSELNTLTNNESINCFQSQLPWHYDSVSVPKTQN